MRKCDNWRGIALLDVVGKVTAWIIQERLQKLAEEELPESQCGSHGCSDMVFTVRQLVEKYWEHRSKSFLVFIDLNKACYPCSTVASPGTARSSRQSDRVN